MAGELLDATTAAGVAEAAVDRVLGLLRDASARADAAAASAAAAAASRDAMVAALKGLGLPVVWSGPTGSVLSIRLPDGSYTAGVDLRGPAGPMRPAPTFVIGTASPGASLAVRADPTTADRYVFDLVAPPGQKGDKGDKGDQGPLGASFVGASATPLPIAVGTVSLVLSAATRAAYAPTLYQALVSGADPRNAMVGVLNGYDAASGTLSLVVQQAAGSGTHSDWTVSSSPPVFVPTGIDGGYAGDPVPPAGATPVYGADATPTYSGVDGGYG